MIRVKGIEEQEKLNRKIKTTLSQFGRERNDDVRLGLAVVDQAPQCVRVSVDGIIDTYNADYFYKQGWRLPDSCFIRVVFDLAKLHYISSYGVGRFVALAKQIKKVGGDLAVFNMQPNVRRIFELLGLIGFLNEVASYEEGVALMASPFSGSI